VNSSSLHRDERGVVRCAWCVGDPLYQRYHDEEWGVPTADDRYLFEKICLEGFQAGLSWLTILRKRKNFRRAFAGFDIAPMARFGARQVTRLMRDEGIVRHRGKIESAINNARRAKEVIAEFGSLAGYVWQFEPERKAAAPGSLKHLPAKTAESIALGRDLKKRGWTFVGPTTMYAFMQAVGLVNDHVIGCQTRQVVQAARSQFLQPG
jgi:DNA-3-methyladenine glycosylase I